MDSLLMTDKEELETKLCDLKEQLKALESQPLPTEFEEYMNRHLIKRGLQIQIKLILEQLSWDEP